MDPSDSDSEVLEIDEIFDEMFDRLAKEPKREPDPEIRRQRQEALARATNTWDEEIIRKQMERAIPGGFSSREELFQHEREVHRQSTINCERNRMEKAAQLGITITEPYAREYPQSERPIPHRRPRCDCDGKVGNLEVGPLLIPSDTEHPIRNFCPRTLLTSRSMDAPVLMEFLEFRHRAKINKLRIEQGAKSKRLADDMLESYWDGDTEEISMKLPFWAEQDEVLQQIIRTKTASDATHSENFDQFTPNSTFAEDLEALKEIATAYWSGHPRPEPRART
ncbi:hypothetical protein MMC22_007399 [Lobaria immixta]|nr:hypothetical protein [Lobaria immixta]